MVISLAVIVLAAGVIYLFVPSDEGDEPGQTVNYQMELDSARRAAPYAVAAPKGLSKDWRATSVRYDGGAGNAKGNATWHLGFLSPDEEYVAVEQSDDSRVTNFVQDVTHRAEKSGKTESVNGDSWDHYAGSKYSALVRQDGRSTTVVLGTASLKELTHFTAALETRKAANPTQPPASSQADQQTNPSDE